MATNVSLYYYSLNVYIIYIGILDLIHLLYCVLMLYLLLFVTELLK